MSQQKIAVCGGGAMGETIIAGLIRAGLESNSITVTDKFKKRLNQLRDTYAVAVTESNTEAVTGASTVVIAVKPGDVPGVLEGIADVLDKNALLISIAAGLPTSLLESPLKSGTAVVRVMPNIPAKVGQGMALISAGRNATSQHLLQTRTMFETLGGVLEIPERLQDAATAVSGSGPAYLFLVAEAMIEAAVGLGVARADSTELVIQTMIGAAALLRETGENPGTLRAQVTSPGGTTAAAVRELERHGLRTAFNEAMIACRDKSAELGTAALTSPRD